MKKEDERGRKSEQRSSKGGVGGVLELGLVVGCRPSSPEVAERGKKTCVVRNTT